MEQPENNSKKYYLVSFDTKIIGDTKEVMLTRRETCCIGIGMGESELELLELLAKKIVAKLGYAARVTLASITRVSKEYYRMLGKNAVLAESTAFEGSLSTVGSGAWVEVNS